MRLNVLSFNVWGLNDTGGRAARRERIAAIGRALADGALDLVGLQEVWYEEDQQVLAKQAARAGLVHSYVFCSGVVMGSGLMVLSRFPILEVAFLEFRLKGRPERIDQGDYYVGKGVGLARLQSPAGPLDFYNLHPVAQYQPDESDLYAAHRAASIYEAAQFINRHSIDIPALVACDLNAQSHQLGYRLMSRLAGLGDVFGILNPHDPGYTFSLLNPYNQGYRASERLDYIWARGTAQQDWALHRAEISLELMPQSDLCYSDHYAVLAEVELRPTPLPPLQAERAEQKALLRELSSVLLAGRIHAEERRLTHRVLAGVGVLLGVFFSWGRVERQRPLTRLLDYALMVFSITTALYNGLQDAVVIAQEGRQLRAIGDEVRVHVASLDKSPE
jgi:endonuclease/exonuclease/phosphatase family metal-dependent hydrolase